MIVFYLLNYLYHFFYYCYCYNHHYHHFNHYHHHLLQIKEDQNFLIFLILLEDLNLVVKALQVIHLLEELFLVIILCYLLLLFLYLLKILFLFQEMMVSLLYYQTKFILFHQIPNILQTIYLFLYLIFKNKVCTIFLY